ncbi:MAG: hypothetical protein J6T97_06680 [Bacteroidaceae bacterium]|nr:hypothetical protein [Bacteroidaceae bacterium]
MKKVILFAIVALLTAPGNIIMARKNTASTIIKETRDEPFTFYANLTNRHTVRRTYKKSMDKLQKEMLEAYGDSISADSIRKMLPFSVGNFDTYHKTSKVKYDIVVAFDSEIKDFAAELDKSHDSYSQFEVNSISDTIYLEGRSKEIAKIILRMMPQNTGISFYYTNESFLCNPGMAVVIYSPDRKVQAIGHFRRRPFRLFF